MEHENAGLMARESLYSLELGVANSLILALKEGFFCLTKTQKYAII